MSNAKDFDQELLELCYDREAADLAWAPTVEFFSRVMV